jgi:PPOX class probable F420-dependent enzyme
MPVWFIWDGEDAVTVYSQPGARVRNLESNPHLTLNFSGDGGGGDIVVLSGTATLDHGGPGADGDSAYVAKYDDHIARIGHTPESFAQRYSVPVRIRLERLRGH